MKVGVVGLGRMGGNTAQRLARGGHQVVGFDAVAPKGEDLAKAGVRCVPSLAKLAEALDSPRAIWVMVPAGQPTDDVLGELRGLLTAGDTVADAGNSNYRDTQRRAQSLRAAGIDLVDVGTSGGVWGLAEGYSLMVGGDRDAVMRLQPLLQTLAPGTDKGWGYVGSSGAGHFVKMIHNGIEYGVMQALAEGFTLLHAKTEFDLDLHGIAEIWRYGSVIRSWLLDLTAAALADDPELSGLRGWVEDTGEGRWTVAEAVDLAVPAPVITLALMMRFASRQDDAYSAKLLAAMRRAFGGHAVKQADSKRRSPEDR